MGDRRIRRKRRHAFRKPDAVIIVLASITCCLLLLWGALYWKEAAKIRSTGVESGVETAPSSTVAAPDGSGPARMTDGASEPPAIGTAENPEAASPAQSESRSLAKPESQNREQPDSPSSVAPEPQHPVLPESPSPANRKPPQQNDNEAEADKGQQYEQSLVLLKAECTKGANAVVSDAEAQIGQLDQTDPSALLKFKSQLEKELAAAESTCNGKFEEVTRKAEKDSVEPEVVQGWKRTFDALKEKLQTETRTKLERLTAG